MDGLASNIAGLRPSFCAASSIAVLREALWDDEAICVWEILSSEESVLGARESKVISEQLESGTFLRVHSSL